MPVSMLHLAAPSVLQLAYICYTTNHGSEQKQPALAPESTFDMLQASSLAIALLPALSVCHKQHKLMYTSSEEAMLWLGQQPATLAAIWSSFNGSGFHWFLWDALASFTAGLHQRHQGVSPACGERVPGDHAAFVSPTNTSSLSTAGFVLLFDCLQFIHIAEPGKQVALCLLFGQEQEQEEEAAVAVSGSIHSSEEGRAAQEHQGSKSSGSYLDSSSRRDRHGTGGNPTTSSSPSGRSSCPNTSGQHKKADENGGGSSGSSEGLHDGSNSSSYSKTCHAVAGQAGGRGGDGGGGISGSGDVYNGQQRPQAGRKTDTKQGPTVEWLLLAAGSCALGTGSSREMADPWEAAAVSPAAAAASAEGSSTRRSGQRELGLASPAGQGLGGVCEPRTAAGAARAAAAGGAGASQAAATATGAAAAAGGAGTARAAAAAGAPRAAATAAAGAAAAGGAGAATGAPSAAAAAGGPAPAGSSVPGASRQTEAESEAAIDVTANRLKLLLELLLLMWPCHKNQLYTMMGTVGLPAIVPAHDWLLLLAGLLQQAPSAAKLQLLEQRGKLLLQLLYEVMLDDDSGRSRHPGVKTSLITEYSGEQASVLLRELAASPAAKKCQGDEPSSSIAHSAGICSSSSSCSAGTVKPVSLVLLVLQSLLYEAVPLSMVEGMPLQPGRMLAVGE